MDITEGHYADLDTPETHLTLINQTTTLAGSQDDMAAMGEAAKQAYQKTGFAAAQQVLAKNTLRRKKNDLANFCTFLTLGGTIRTPEGLMNDAQEWVGINMYIVAGFKQWLIEAEYRYTTINAHLATVRHFCKLSGPVPMGGAGVLDADTVLSINTVTDITAKQAANLDEDRAARGLQTSKGKKKAFATPITLDQARALRNPSRVSELPPTRPHDLLLVDRDKLMNCLMLQHSLRCSEVRDLDIENFDLVAGTMIFYRKKTRKTETHTLQKQTLAAAQTYLLKVKKLEKRISGPLFTGYKDKDGKHKRISTATINARVGLLGRSEGIDALSPHDLRHEWTVDALRNGTSIDRVQSGGGWTSEVMVLRYAKRAGIANAGVKVTEDD